MTQFTNAFYSLLKLCVVSVLVSRCSYPYGEVVDAFHYRAPNNSNNNNNRHKHNLCKQHQNIEKKMTTSLLPLHLFPSSSSADEKNTNNVPGRWAGGRAVDVVRTTAAAATLAILLTTTTTAAAAATAATTTTTSNSAAQVYLNQIPPTEISIEVSDLPIVGKLVSGRYAKVDDNKATTKNKRNDAAPQPSSSSPSIVIKSPKDTVKAITGIAKNGHIEIDLAGDVGLRTHLDVDVAADEAGVATVRIASDLIPPLPFKNLASSSQSSSVTKGGGKQSQWNTVTNMGNGETYYFNTKTGATQYEKPDKI